MKTDMEDRINELEVKLGFTEDLVEALNQTVFRQQQQIDLLIEAVRNLRDQVQSAEPAEFRSLRDEIPPHY